MVTPNNDGIAQYKGIVVDYIRQFEMVPFFEAHNKWNEGTYQYVIFMRTFTQENDDVPHQLMIPTSKRDQFLSTIGTLLDGKVNRKLVDRVVGHVIHDLNEWPFSEETITEYAEIITTELVAHYTSKYIALVPVGIFSVFDRNIGSIPLANTVLHFGGSSSHLAERVNDPQLREIFTEEKISEKDSYFLMNVSGDTESIRAQVQAEVQLALAVLRFVTGWRTKLQGTKQIQFNPAMEIDAWSLAHSHIVYFDPTQPERRSGVLSRSNVGGMNISQSWIDFAHNYGLNDINYHLQNQNNEFSKRVARALVLYDSGTIADTSWQSMYRYVACIDTALSAYYENKNKLQIKLEKLIDYGNNYIGSISGIEENDTNPPTYSWKDIVTKIAQPFLSFYMLRNDIIHGKIIDVIPEQLHSARNLAHNTVRLLAHVSHELGWQTDDDAKDWFENSSESQ